MEGGKEWKQIRASYKVPSDRHSLRLFFSTKDENPGHVSPLYIDDIEIELIGQEESFEEEKNIAAIRGAGHLPFLFVTDRESVDGKGHSLCVTRQEKDATVKLDVSAYVGYTVDVSMYVKTADRIIRAGLDGAEPKKLAEVNTTGVEWNLVEMRVEIPEGLTSAELFIETDGNADFFVDDVFVRPVN